MSPKVFVMLSGGVDSSVAAARLVDCGFDVTGIYMRNWSSDNISNHKVREMLKSCNSDEDEIYAKATADHLRLPFRVVNFEQEYWDKVIEPFFAGIKSGSMPNPDIWCNQYIKYGVFLDWAINSGADYVASGHYVRLNLKSKVKSQKSKLQFKTQNQEIQLLRGVDESKDQSYFLSQVPKEKLQYALFPIGHLYKTDVRKEAVVRGLPAASRPDSQGICFVGKIPLKEFLKERFKTQKGEVRFIDGTKIGEHDGVYFYTIGERLGFHRDQKSKIKNQNDKLKFKNIFGDDKKPLYIVEKDLKENILVVGEDDGTYPLWQNEFTADSWNWFKYPQENQIYDIEIRYHQQPKSRGIIKTADKYIFQKQNNFSPAEKFSSTSPRWLPSGDTKPSGAAGCSSRYIRQPSKMKIEKLVPSQSKDCELKIRLEEPVRAVTSGQTVVLSIGDRIIGSGIIK